MSVCAYQPAADLIFILYCLFVFHKGTLFLRKYLCLTANVFVFNSACVCSAIGCGGFGAFAGLLKAGYRHHRSLIHEVTLYNWKFNLCSGAEICQSQQLSFVFVRTHKSPYDVCCPHIHPQT